MFDVDKFKEENRRQFQGVVEAPLTRLLGVNPAGATYDTPFDSTSGASAVWTLANGQVVRVAISAQRRNIPSRSFVIRQYDNSGYRSEYDRLISELHAADELYAQALLDRHGAQCLAIATVETDVLIGAMSAVFAARYWWSRDRRLRDDRPQGGLRRGRLGLAHRRRCERSSVRGARRCAARLDGDRSQLRTTGLARRRRPQRQRLNPRKEEVMNDDNERDVNCAAHLSLGVRDE